MTGPSASQRTLANLGEHLQHIAAARDKESRRAAFARLALEAERAGAVDNLLARLLARGANGQRFALEVAALITPPLPVGLLSAFVDLLENSRFSTRIRVAVAAQVLRSAPSRAALIDRVLRALIDEVSPSRALKRLRRLAAAVPPSPQLAQALLELDAGSVAPCPRCGARLGPDDLVRHMWEKHRLLLESGRVREPWDLIGQWVGDFLRTERAEFLDRSCELAQALDPSGGLSRVHRLLLLGGSGDEEARHILRSEAAEQQATLCPHCFTLVPQPLRVAPTPVVISHGQVDGGRFRVSLNQGYAFNRLVVQTPELDVFHGAEPGHALTRRGAVLLFLLPLVGLACVFAVMPALAGLPPVVPVAALLFVALFAYAGVWATWHQIDNPTDRAVNHAWTTLVPRMLQYQVRRGDAAFLAGLAAACRGRGNAEQRDESLRDAGARLQQDSIGLPYLTPLTALRISDAAQAGADDLPLIAEQIGDCFDGALPLEHAERLVRDLRGDPVQRTRRVRLRVLILARAFNAGLEAEDLRIIGQICPALGSSYASEDRDGLARLKLLWLYKPRRLWQRIGSATTVFDLARYPKLAENYLKLRPDLLLFQASVAGDEAAPILICEEGVVYREALITDPTASIRVRPRASHRGGGYELSIGKYSYKFRHDPTLLARRLKAWAEFLFDEFLPRAKLLTSRRSDEGDRLLPQKACTCPECRKVFLGLTGEIGFAALPPASVGVE